MQHALTQIPYVLIAALITIAGFLVIARWGGLLRDERREKCGVVGARPSERYLFQGVDRHLGYWGLYQDLGYSHRRWIES